MSEMRDFYSEAYSTEDAALGDRLARWRALGGENKARHVTELMRGETPARMVEIGCGDGALLAALAARGFAGAYDGFELAPEAVEIAVARAVPGAGRIEAFDGEHVPAADDTYDLAVISHVLEHVPDPAPLLREAARVARRVIIEVPLEDNPSARRPAVVAEARRIGHLHAFSRQDMQALGRGAGLRVVRELSDPLGRDHHTFFADDGRSRATTTAKWALRAALWRAAPLRAERLFTVHYAALLER